MGAVGPSAPMLSKVNVTLPLVGGARPYMIGQGTLEECIE